MTALEIAQQGLPLLEAGLASLRALQQEFGGDEIKIQNHLEVAALSLAMFTGRSEFIAVAVRSRHKFKKSWVEILETYQFVFAVMKRWIEAGYPYIDFCYGNGYCRPVKYFEDSRSYGPGGTSRQRSGSWLVLDRMFSVYFRGVLEEAKPVKE